MRSVRSVKPEDNTKFVYLLKANSCIWDPNHKDYKNNNVRDRAWKYVAERVCMSVPKCKGKYKELRDRYRRELQGKPPVNGVGSLRQQLDFLRRTFKNYNDSPVSSVPTTSSAHKVNQFNHNVNFNATHRSLRSTPSIQYADPIDDPLFLDIDQLSNASMKIEEFPRNLAALRILDPSEITVHVPNHGTNDTNEKNDDTEVIPLGRIRTKAARKETDDQIIPILPPVPHYPQASGFALALDEKLKLLPPRERNRLEKKIFVVVADEVDKTFI